MPIVYQATNKINGKRYIGKTVGTLVDRKRDHERSAERGSKFLFHKAIRKNGAGNFIWDILSYHADDADAIAAEIKWIAEKRSEYNMTKGGEGANGFKFSIETRMKMSAAHKGKKMPPHMSVLLAKRNAERVWSDESREKIRAALAGRKLSPEHRANAVRGQIGRKPTRQRPVICLTDGRKFLSGRDAERAYNMPKGSVSQICTRSPKISGYRRFAYISDKILIVSMLSNLSEG